MYPSLPKKMGNKNHDVPYEPITRSKASKINQSFVLHVQEWIGAVHPQFYMSHIETRDEWPFKVLNVNVFSIEADYEIEIKLPWSQ